ncbi:MAG: enoyl-CoA hydratase/isomerase family protein [Rhizobiales bacterium]|nr:enoyl-CoA hydratase/isomerase family protein [Hyphomicrobiales bacterium]
MDINIENLQNWSFEVDVEKIAWATIDCPNQSMNTLGERSFKELEAIIDEVQRGKRNSEIIGLILISGKKNNFIAGADIKEFEQLDTVEKVKEVTAYGTGLFQRMEDLKVPVVVAINGFCLGGGLEMAMACHYRIATRSEGTRVGLPEVKLGIIPGIHGTVRMLRLAGPLNGMTAMLTGRMLKAPVAKAFGLVDQLVPSDLELRWAARKAVLQNRKSKAGNKLTHKLMRLSPVRKFLASQMRSKTKAKVREDHYPAPFKLIDLFEHHGGTEADMFKEEQKTFAPLMVSETSRNLRRVFHLSEEMKALAPKNSEYKPLRAHIIGAGTMGADIASWCVVSGMDVTLQDMSIEQIEKAQKGAKKLFRKRLKKPVAVEAAMARLTADPDGKGVKRADIIIEAIVENLEIKQELFKNLEKEIKPGAVLASNTSSLSLEEIASSMEDEGRLIGIHFFNPVAQMPLVEVVSSEKSRKEEVEKGCAFVTKINKYPLIVKSCKGFLVNRVLAPYMMESIRQLDEGVPPEKIDQAALDFGMPMGPIELIDVVGLDICKHVSHSLELGDADNSELGRLVAKGKLGKKTGEGFYLWKDGKPEKKQETYEESELISLADELISPLLTECEKCDEENVAPNRGLIDAGIIFGTGFAPFRGGPLHYLDHKDN